jgi:hypothetical protein
MKLPLHMTKLEYAAVYSQMTVMHHETVLNSNFFLFIIKYAANFGCSLNISGPLSSNFITNTKTFIMLYIKYSDSLTLIGHCQARKPLLNSWSSNSSSWKHNTTVVCNMFHLFHSPCMPWRVCSLNSILSWKQEFIIFIWTTDKYKVQYNNYLSLVFVWSTWVFTNYNILKTRTKTVQYLNRKTCKLTQNVELKLWIIKLE